MMNGRGKSDSAIVAGKPTNKAGQPAAESVEPSAEAEGNASQQSTRRAQDRESVSQALERIRQVARQRKKERFTSLFHHISVELLRVAFFALKRDAAPGVDGLTWQDYEADLDRKIEDLHARVHRGAYRALPSRRHYIPKADGQQRPLAIAALEDKIVQKAACAVLNAIYEEDFLGFSYGFRPKRSQHDALDALITGIHCTKVNYIFDADLRSFFDSVSQQWLMRFLKHRINDTRMLRLIQKWLKAGVLEDNVVEVDEPPTEPAESNERSDSDSKEERRRQEELQQAEARQAAEEERRRQEELQQAEARQAAEEKRRRQEAENKPFFWNRFLAMLHTRDS